MIAAPVWAVIDVIYVVIQDKYFFIRMFPGYKQYAQQVPMLIPTRKSISQCVKSIKSGIRKEAPG
jgi:protein-S-isoprenylcysteine O-methyltransferase Ste14